MQLLSKNPWTYRSLLQCILVQNLLVWVLPKCDIRDSKISIFIAEIWILKNSNIRKFEKIEHSKFLMQISENSHMTIE